MMEGAQHLVARQLLGDPPPPIDPALLPHDTKKVGIIVMAAVFYFISILFVAARIYTRKVMMRALKPMCGSGVRSFYLAHYDMDRSTPSSRQAFTDRVRTRISGI